LLAASVMSIQDSTELVRAFTRDVEFDYVGWTVEALRVKFFQSALGIEDYLTTDARRQMVLEYLQLVHRIQEVEGELGAVYADPDIRYPEVESAPLKDQLDDLVGRRDRLQPIAESIMQAKGAASSASVLMNPGQYTMVMLKAIVDKERCSKCFLCVNNCPYDAISMTETGADIDEIKCRGCGICVMSCPSQAVTVRNSRDDQFKAVIDNLLYRSIPEETE